MDLPSRKPCMEKRFVKKYGDSYGGIYEAQQTYPPTQTPGGPRRTNRSYSP